MILGLFGTNGTHVDVWVCADACNTDSYSSLMLVWLVVVWQCWQYIKVRLDQSNKTGKFIVYLHCFDETGNLNAALSL